MQISKVHTHMIVWSTLSRSPLTDPNTGQRLMQNRGVRKEWRVIKREEANGRARNTRHERTKAHRLGRCLCPDNATRTKRRVARKSR